MYIIQGHRYIVSQADSLPRIGMVYTQTAGRVALHPKSKSFVYPRTPEVAFMTDYVTVG